MRRKADILYNILDEKTGETNTYKKETVFPGGATITDADCDGAYIRKKGSEYFLMAFSGGVSAAKYGASTSNADNSLPFSKAIVAARKLKRPVDVVGGEYTMTNPVAMTSTDFPDQNGVTFRGVGSYRTVKINYSGAPYAFSYDGTGDEGGTPITRFQFENITVSGNNNSTSGGGFRFSRAYIVKLINCSSTSWAAPLSHACEFRNNFNLLITGGNYSNGFPLPSGGDVIVVGSQNPDPWNSSNIQIRDTLIQRGGGVGLNVSHDGNILDNLVLDNISFGGNQGGSFKCFSSNVNNITVTNCHFESAGYNGTSTPVDANHIDIDSSSCVFLNNNEFKDAKIHIKLHRVNAFKINPNKIYETGAYTIASSTGISITGTSSAYSIGTVEHQNIFSNQIDTPYVIDAFSRVAFPDDVVTEAQWTAKYSGSPAIYKNNIVTRSEIKAGNADQEFQSKWISGGTNWFRLQLNERGVGWGSAMPSTGSYTQGDMIINRTPSLSSVAGFRYTVYGWRRLTSTSNNVLGTDWAEMRDYHELTFYTAATGYDPPSIAANSQVTTTVTVTGATVGQMALASFTISGSDGLTNNVELIAKVTATNTVTLVFKNITASPIDLGSGSLNVRVF